MHNLLLFIFCISVALILHTYLFYPFFMLNFFKKNKVKIQEFDRNEELPDVAVLIAAYNEEKVIHEKIVSVFNSNYPSSKIKVLVGSDASDDKTDEIIERLCKTHPNLEFVKFKGRVGKIEIINHLSSLCQQKIFVLTDANVFFKPHTIYELVKLFKDERVGMVAGNIVKESEQEEGITYQEKKYLSLENGIKKGESNAFQLIMGAEGGCYAIRNDLFARVPSNFIVDDFYMTLKVLNKGKFVLFNELALCTEDVDSDTHGEYRRKVRISSGNFQNLFFFKNNLWPFWIALPFVFWSHKVLRWLTPFFLLLSLFVSALLSFHSLFFVVVFALQLLGFLFPLINYLFTFNNSILKFISHFYLMNFALLQGFLKFCKGIKSSVWQPVKRNV